MAAADVLAPLMECALNVLVSMPAEVITSFNQRAMVDDVTGLCGFMKEINNWVLSPLSMLVLCTYMVKEWIGHNFVSSEKQGKKTP